MLTSISPLGERARGNTWAVTVAWLAAGSLMGGAVVGAAVATIGRILGTVVAASGRLAGGGSGDRLVLSLLAAACAAAAAWDWTGRSVPGRRQVNENWLVALRPWAYGVGFGVQLGAGVVTTVNTALVPVFLLAATISADSWSGLFIGAVFGTGRGLTLLATSRVRSTEDLRVLHRRLDGRAETARRAGAGLALLLGIAAVAATVTL